MADFDNHRVLEYNTPLITDTVADQVFGQGGSFTSATCNLGGISASSLCFPTGVAVDAAGNLYVADGNNGNNNRVLEYNTPLITDTVADRVFGQGGSFTSNTCNLGGISASSLCRPAEMALDAAGNLYVSDTTNSRVLEYDSPLATPTPSPTPSPVPTPTPTPSPMPTPTAAPGDTVADRVFGQAGGFTTGACDLGGISPSSLCGPQGMALDAAGNLYVADFTNNRVLEYNTPLTTDRVADRVFGQAGSFTTNSCNLGNGVGGPASASSLCGPSEMAVEPLRGRHPQQPGAGVQRPFDHRHGGRPGVRPGGQLHEQHLQQRRQR